jgi:hypothetical protein
MPIKKAFLIKESMPPTKNVISPWEAEEPNDGSTDSHKENLLQQMKLLPGLKIEHMGEDKKGVAFLVSFDGQNVFWIYTDTQGKVNNVLRISKNW